MILLSKAPGSVITITFDWDNEFLDSGDTIATSSWAVVPTGGLSVTDDSNTTSQTSAELTGGTAGSVYKVTNTVTTGNGETITREATVRVHAR